MGRIFPACTTRWTVTGGLANSIEPADLEIAVAPGLPRLSQNFPNPFRGQTAIQFDVPTASHVTLQVFDLSGRLVTTILDADMEAGSREVTWRGQDDSGQAVGAGVYFYRLTGKDFVKTKKMLLIQ